MWKFISVVVFAALFTGHFSVAAVDTSLGSSWNMSVFENEVASQALLQGNKLTRLSSQKVNVTFIAQDFPAVNAAKVKRLMKAARLPANSLHEKKENNVSVYMHRSGNNLVWYSSAGGRLTASFNQLGPQRTKEFFERVKWK